MRDDATGWALMVIGAYAFVCFMFGSRWQPKLKDPSEEYRRESFPTARVRRDKR